MTTKKTITGIFPAAIGGLLAALALLGPAAAGPAETEAASRIIYVAADCTTAPSPCYTHIQTAIIAADPGDEIHIAGGTYTDFYSSYVAKVEESLTLRGGYNLDFTQRDPEAYPTIVDAEGEKRALYIGLYTGETITVTLDGLHLVRGNADGLGGEEYTANDVGGGLYAAHVHLHLVNCHIADNRATKGGGLYLAEVNAVISRTRIYSNVATSLDGGGLYNRGTSPLTIQNSVISGNVAHSMGGGGLVGNVTLADNLIFDNSSSWGGGGLLLEGPVTLNGNRLLHNGPGGGLFCRNCTGPMSNNILAGNQDYGLQVIGGQVTLLHSTIADNEGTGLQVSNSGQASGRVTATNTILAGNETAVSVDGQAIATLEATLWWDNDTDTAVGQTGSSQLYTGTHNYSGAPLFAADTDYHLRATSPAVDRGLDIGVHSDIDGDPRPWGPAPDLGADEYLPVPPSNVSIAGPPFGLTNGSVDLTATVHPATVLLPITYTWQATGQTPVIHRTASLTDRVTFTWAVTGTNFYPVTGTKRITVTVDNGYGEARGYHTIVIKAARAHLYLPIVVRRK